MKTIYKKYHTSLFWNTLESVGYQAILLFYQLWLFKVTDGHLFGLVGTLFATLYFVISIANFGLDSSFSLLFKTARRSKQSFKNIMTNQFLIQFLILTVGSIILYLLNPFSFAADPLLFLIFNLLVVAESIKKSLRMLAKLAFLNHKTTIVEFLFIISYIAGVTLFYYADLPFSIYTIFTSLLITSTLAVIFLVIILKNWYNKLPENTLSQTISYHSIFKTRCFNFIRNVSHSFCSSNFLVPLFALSFGLEYAGIFKLISAIVHCITVVLHKIFDSAHHAILSTAHATQKRAVFSYISNRMYHILFGTMFFFLLNCSKLLAVNNLHYNYHIWLVTILFFLVQISEHFFISYEALYITENKSEWLLLFHLIPLSILIGLYYFTATYSPVIILSILLAMRVASFTLLATFSFYFLRISSSWHLKPKYFFPFVIVSLIIYFFA